MAREALLRSAGDYDYNHDPSHEDHQDDPEWRNTPRGESTGSNAKNKIAVQPRKSVEDIAPHSPEHISCLRDASRYVKEYATSNIDSLYTAEDEATNLNGFCARNAFPQIAKFVDAFADRGKPRYEHILASLVEHLRRIPKDPFRSHGHRTPKFTKRQLEDFSAYVKYEQDVIRASGIVNSDDTVTLFRNTTPDQFPDGDFQGYYGKSLRYQGGSIESWTINPYYETGNYLFAKPSRLKISARVPLELCIASCIGRRDTPFMMEGRQENEVMVCGAELKRVSVVGIGKNILCESAEHGYFRELRQNLDRYAKRHSSKGDPGKMSSISFNPSGLVWNALIADEIHKLADKLRSINRKETLWKS